MPVLYGVYVLSLLVSSTIASGLQQNNAEVQTYRGFGIEEIALFFIGLGVASALALAIVIGPLFAIFYSSVNGLPFGGINGANTINTSATGSRTSDFQKEIEKILSEKLSEGIKYLEEAIKKYNTSDFGSVN